jgi:hypothetical protein
MRPAAGLDDPSAGEQFIEPGITVGVDYASEVLQVSSRVLAFAVGRVEEQSGRRPRASKRPLVTHIGPQSAGLGLASTWRQDRHRGVIDMKGIAGKHLGSEGVDERLQRCRRGANPAGQGRGFQVDPIAGEDLGLAVKMR